MITLEQIQKEISEHESKPLTAENCKILSSLYIIREYLGKGTTEQLAKTVESIPPSPPLDVVKPNDSVFQNYNNYIQAKRDYQMRNIPKDKLIYSLEVLSQEIKDFFAKLYRNTDTSEEREIIIALINNINVGNI